MAENKDNDERKAQIAEVHRTLVWWSSIYTLRLSQQGAQHNSYGCCWRKATTLVIHPPGRIYDENLSGWYATPFYGTEIRNIPKQSSEL